MSRIFISHSSKDDAAAESMKSWLEKQGYRSLFLDFDPEVGIEAGTEWKQVLYRKLRQSQAVIALVTPNWLASQWCDREVTLADEKGKSIFVVKVEPCDDSKVFQYLQHVDLAGDRKLGYQRLANGLKAKGLDPKDTFDWDPSRPPYPGLHSFDERDAAIFFGRDAEIHHNFEVLNQLRDRGADAPRFVLFLGASGSGKSSLVRAGVLPRLRKDTFDWLPLRPFRPQQEPLEELALVLAEGFKAFQQPRDWEEILVELTAAAEADPPEGKVLTRLARSLQVTADRPEATILLTIDQAEELIGYSASEAADRFLRLLRAALEVADRQLMVLATMRSDFLAEFQTHSVLAGFDYESVTVDPMPLENVPEIVERPAQLADVRFDPGLVSRLQADAATRDALPLLAFTLRRLYDKYADDHLLELREYEQLGGLEGSVRQTVDHVLEQVKPNAGELEALRSAFVPQMVRISEDAQYARCLAYRDRMPGQAEPLLNKFVDARLIVSDRDREGRETLEVAHEALLRTWPQLVRWLEEDRTKLGIVAKLKRAAQDWVQGEKSAEHLVHREGLLQVAKELLEQEQRFAPDEGSEEKAYLDACIEAQRKRERERKRVFQGAIASLSIVLAMVSGLSLWALHNASEVRRKDTELLLDIAKTTAFNSHSLLATGDDRSRAMFEVFRARNLIDHVVNLREDVLSEIWYALHASSTNLRHRQILEGHSASVLAVEFNPVFNPVGNTLASSSNDGRLGLWDSQGKFVAIEGHTDAVSAVEFSPDGQTLASASDDGTVRLWDSQGNLVAILDGHTDAVNVVAFSPDGQTLASASNDGTVRLWDSQGNLVAILDGHSSSVLAVDFSSNNAILASASADGTVQLWLRNGTRLDILEGHSQKVTDVESSPDSTILASASADRTVRLW
ncbi:MAG: TIR domain-containing protein [Cyanobacteria bacterium P01_E01_bin.45]